MVAWISLLFFFFQAEDGIRDKLVTGVQTCALPIWRRADARRPRARGAVLRRRQRRERRGGEELHAGRRRARRDALRSEERRVGKECRSRWSKNPAKNYIRQMQVKATNMNTLLCKRC